MARQRGELVSEGLAEALWNTREEVRDVRERLTSLRDLVNSPGDLSLGQWAQLYAFTLDLAPDLIIELGRGYGNSTCVFTEVASQTGKTRVVSIGYDGEHGWTTRTAPRLLDVVDREWFDPLDIREKNILDVDFEKVAGDSRRIFLFWDAHGNDVANYVLGAALPCLSEEPRDLVVGVHDMGDARYESPSREYARADGLQTFWQGYLVSSFEEVVPLFDFLSRNRLPFTTAREALDSLQRGNASEWAELEEVLIDYPELSPLREGGWMSFRVGRDDGEEIVFPSVGSSVGEPPTRRLLHGRRAPGIRVLRGGRRDS